MARTLKVVFRSDVRGIAQAGDVKIVSPGYARNYLFPRELAFPANDAALRQWETERQGTLAKAVRTREQAEAIAQRVEAATCTVKAKAGQEGRIFGSISRQEILDALAKDGITLDKRALELPEPIRHLGASVVTVRLPSGIQAQLKVNVVAEG
jgi:large subunit ribosomal protein L9